MLHLAITNEYGKYVIQFLTSTFPKFFHSSPRRYVATGQVIGRSPTRTLRSDPKLALALLERSTKGSIMVSRVCTEPMQWKYTHLACIVYSLVYPFRSFHFSSLYPPFPNLSGEVALKKLNVTVPTEFHLQTFKNEVEVLG